MISACSSHPEKVRDTLCLSLQCKDKGLVCAQCAAEKHQCHYSVSLTQFKDSLGGNAEINEATAVLLQQVNTFQDQVEGKYQSLVGNLLEIQRKFNSEIEQLIKVYYFNKDYSFKIMNKIQNFLENMNKLSDITKEEELNDLVTYFSLMVYEKETQSFENNLKDHLEAMSTKCGTISSFFSKHEASILENCKTVEESIQQMMCSEVDILQILEIQRYEANPDQFKILVAREKDSLKKIAIIDAKKSQIDSLDTIVSKVFENFGLDGLNNSSVQLRHPDSHIPILQLDQLQGYNSVIAELKYSPQQVSPLFIIGISGSARCGKRTLSQQLSLALNADVLRQDFFFDKEKIHSKLNGNWESEDSIDWVAFKQFVDKEVTKKKAKGGYLIIEGIQLFCQEWIRNLCDVKYFLQIDEMTMYVRRMRATAVPESYFWNTIVQEDKIYKQKLDALQAMESIPEKKIVYLNAQDSPQQLFETCLNAIRQ